MERRPARALCQRVEHEPADPVPALDAPGQVLSPIDATLRYLPALFRAAGITLLLSCLAMTLAVAVGMAVAIGRAAIR